jgi:hypothetical protein
MTQLTKQKHLVSDTKARTHTEGVPKQGDEGNISTYVGRSVCRMQ